MNRLRIRLIAILMTGLASSPIVRAADTPADPRLITVNGSGEVTAMPDRARLTMSVEIIKPDIKTARGEADRVTREYLTKARALGAKDEDIESTGFNMRPEYDYGQKPGTAPRLTGYRATHSIGVLVRDLDHLGDFLQAATDCGINNVSAPELESSRADALNREALAHAALDARAKAQVLADTLGAKLGPVHSINAGGEDTAPPRPMMRMMAKSAAEPGGNDDSGVNVGEMRISASLTAQFDILPP